MKKVLTGMSFFNALGFKKQFLALAVCVSAGLMTVDVAEAASSPNQNPPAIKAGAPNVYVVRKGDTLWDISGKFLKTPWRWREIWASNRHVKNPHWIYPGDRLLLCTLNGKPLIGKDEGDGCEGIIRRQGGNTLHPQIRVESLNNAIPVIPLEYIRHWLERATIVGADSIEHTPYIIGAADQRVIAGKGQTVYARGNGLNVGERYAVYREGEPYTFKDAEGKPYTIGLELIQVASAVAVQNDNDIATLEITDSYNGEVRQSDRVLPEVDAMLPTLFYPTSATDVRDGGQVIRVMGSISSAARHGVVTINRGTQDGVQVGHVFSTAQQGEVVKDPKTKEAIKLPNQRVGNIMIFKAFNQLSYGYVLDSELPIKVGAAITPPAMSE